MLPVAIDARRCCKKAIVVPEANAREAAVVEGIDVFGVQSLRQVFPTGAEELFPMKEDIRVFFEAHRNYDVDFCEVKGQPSGVAYCADFLY